MCAKFESGSENANVSLVQILTLFSDYTGTQTLCVALIFIGGTHRGQKGGDEARTFQW